MVTHEVTSLSYGNALGYGLSVLNWGKMYGKACGNAYGNALHYGLSIFIEFGNVW